MPSRAILPVILAFALAITAGAHGQDLPPQIADRFTEGVTALRANDLDKAEHAFRDVLAAGGNRAFVHHNLGIVLQQRGRHAEALAEFRAAATLDPAFGPAPLLAGASLLALGRNQEAIASLQKAARLLPDEPSVYLQLATACERTGNLASEVEALRNLNRIDPANHEWAFRLGRAYLRMAQWSFEQLVAVNPHSGRLAQALALQYLDQGRPDLARVTLEEAARHDPTLPEIHLTLARIHANERRWDDAAREVSLELALVPWSAAARELKAAIDAARATP